jgi:alkylation response protein AidB-like acyl-CoA dehydrogenase
MEFGYTPEQQHLRKTVRAFCEAEIKPHVMEWDESQTFPDQVFRKLGELGVLGAVFPEELGGSDYSYVDYSLVVEELARVDPSVALCVAAHVSLCTNHIFLAGSDEQKQRYIPKLTSGEWIGSWALTEPESGSDAGGTHTRAVLERDCWVINGNKTFTTNGQVADVCVVMAVTDRSASSHGISAFLVEKGTAGFRPGKKRK